MRSSRRAFGKSEWDAVRSVKEKLGVGSSETVRKWVRRAQAMSSPADAKAAEESEELNRPWDHEGSRIPSPLLPRRAIKCRRLGERR